MKKYVAYIEWLGTVSSILGSFLVAYQIDFVGYLFFLVGVFAWLYSGFVTQRKPLIVLNLAFLIANIIGLYNAF